MGTNQPVALITGAGSGIGRACAIALARAQGGGHRVALVGRREGPLKETAGMIPGGGLVLSADVGDAASIGAAVDRAVSQFGRLDVLVNNAGDAPLEPIGRTTPELLGRVYRVNALAPAYAIVRVWPVFTRQKRGVIVNVSTMGTVDPFPGFFAYASAKAAVNTMARSCALEGREHGIRAFAVAPGAVETGMLRALFDEKTLPRDRVLQPEQVAGVIVDCILGRRDDENGGTILLPSP